MKGSIRLVAECVFISPSLSSTADSVYGYSRDGVQIIPIRQSLFAGYSGRLQIQLLDSVFIIPNVDTAMLPWS